MCIIFTGKRRNTDGLLRMRRDVIGLARALQEDVPYLPPLRVNDQPRLVRAHLPLGIMHQFRSNGTIADFFESLLNRTVQGYIALGLR